MKKYLIILILFLSLPMMVNAANWIEQGLNTSATEAKLVASDYTTQSAESLAAAKIGSILQALFTLLGLIFLVLVIFGGVTYMTSGGDPGKAKKAKGYILNAVIGLILMGLAYAITEYVITRVTFGL